MPRPTVRPDECPNCGTPLTDAFCPRCGQNNRHHRLEAREMLGTAFEHLLELDVPIVRTFVGLSLRPGRVCRDYIEGRRKRYSNPLRYCIVAGAVLVLVLVVFDLNPSASLQGHFATSSATPAGNAAAPESGAPAADGTGGKSRSQRASEYIGTHAPRVVEGSLNVIGPLATPFMALALMVLFPRKGYTFAEHFAFSLFVFGHGMYIGILSSLLVQFAGLIGLSISMVIDVAYFTWAAAVCYRSRVWTTVPRMAIWSIWYYLVAVAMGTIVVMLWAVWLFGSGEIWNRI